MPFPKTYRCGEPIRDSDGLHIGATRYLPRGVRKEALSEYFDVWLSLVAPSKELIAEFKKEPASVKTFERFSLKYKKEISKSPQARQTIGLLAKVADKLQLFVGCFCENENFCHRSILREEIIKRMP